MRFLMLLKANKDTEAGVMPEQKTLEAMQKYKRRAREGGRDDWREGCTRARRARACASRRGKPSVVDRAVPRDQGADRRLLDDSGEVEAGSNRVGARRSRFQPDVHFGGDGEVELRQVFEAEDFGEELTPELRDAEQRLRDEITKSGR
jgi:hypothetical protein